MRRSWLGQFLVLVWMLAPAAVRAGNFVVTVDPGGTQATPVVALTLRLSTNQTLPQLNLTPTNFPAARKGSLFFCATNATLYICNDGTNWTTVGGGGAVDWYLYSAGGNVNMGSNRLDYVSYLNDYSGNNAICVFNRGLRGSGWAVDDDYLLLRYGADFNNKNVSNVYTIVGNPTPSIGVVRRELDLDHGLARGSWDFLNGLTVNGNPVSTSSVAGGAVSFTNPSPVDLTFSNSTQSQVLHWTRTVATNLTDSSNAWTDTASGQISHWNFESNTLIEGDSWAGNNGMTNVGSVTWTITGTNADGGAEHGYTFPSDDSRYFVNASLTGLSATQGAFMAWAKTTVDSGYQRIVSFWKHDSAILTGFYFEFQMDGGNKYVQVNVYKDGVQQWYGTTAASSITNGQWYHIAVLQNGVAPTTYLNGILVPFTVMEVIDKKQWTKAVLTDAVTTADAMTIGNTWYNSTYYYGFDGTIDDVRIYTNCPTSNQVWQTFSSTCPTNPPGNLERTVIAGSTNIVTNTISEAMWSGTATANTYGSTGRVTRITGSDGLHFVLPVYTNALSGELCNSNGTVMVKP